MGFKRANLKKVDRQRVKKFVCDEHSVLSWVLWDIGDGMVEVEINVAF